MRDSQMMATRLSPMGRVIYEILRRRGCDTSSLEIIAAEFASRGFEKRVGRRANKQNLSNWFNRGVRADIKFGAFFCDEFVESNQEESWVALTLLYPDRIPPDFPQGR